MLQMKHYEKFFMVFIGCLSILVIAATITYFVSGRAFEVPVQVSNGNAEPVDQSKGKLVLDTNELFYTYKLRETGKYVYIGAGHSNSLARYTINELFIPESNSKAYYVVELNVCLSQKPLPKIMVEEWSLAAFPESANKEKDDKK